MSSKTPPLILFTYPESVVGRRTEWYLLLRRIPYSTCRTDTKMPRPVLSSLGAHYRRIPVLAIGRDIYCDSRCIMDVLESLIPSSEYPRLGAEGGWEHGVEKLFENFAFEGGLFHRTAQLITPDAKLVQDPVWLDDRYQLTGFKFSNAALEAIRPDALSATRRHLDLIEGMLADGREWLMGGKEPGIADVHVGWPFDWMTRDPEMMGMKGHYEELLNEKMYPKVYAWVRRLNELVDERRKEVGGVKKVSGEEAIKTIENAGWFEGEKLGMPEWDPTGLKRGEEVDLYATDVPSGFDNRDTGELAGMTEDRVTIKTKTNDGVDVRIHYPRINIRIAQAKK